MKKIFITGGHVTPALALIDEIRSSYAEWNVVYVGRTVAIEGSQHISPEQELIETKGVKFLPITAGRLTRTLSPHSVSAFFKIPVGFGQAFSYCLSERPDIVVSFGGYIALPVAVAAYVLRIPVITHEQTLSAGLTNRIIARFAKTVCVSFEETKKEFPGSRVVVTGLPLRREFFETDRKKPDGIKDGKDILYVTGGATGAVSLNEIVFQSIRRLTGHFVVVHQTGKISYAKAARLRENLPDNLKDRYTVRDYFHSQDVGWIMKKARLVVGRSGANTVMELALLGKRAVLIPLPWSAGGEQMKNALWLKSLGLAQVLEQHDLSPDRLLASIKEALRIAKNDVTPALARIPRDGARRLAREIADILS